MPTSDDIRDTFNFPTLTLIVGEPTFATVTLLQKEQDANACSVNSTLGGGAHGLLGLTTSSKEYRLLTKHRFRLLKPPGPLPIFPSSTSQEY